MSEMNDIIERAKLQTRKMNEMVEIDSDQIKEWRADEIARITERSKLSDDFFSFDEVSDEIEHYSERGDVDMDIVKRAAASFLRLHPNCSYSAEWLIEDFVLRLVNNENMD